MGPVCTDSKSCAELKMVLESALSLVEESDRARPKMPMTTVTVDSALPIRFVERLKTNPSVILHDPAREDEPVDLSLFGDTSTPLALEVAKRSKVSNVFVTDPVTVCKENMARSKSNALRYVEAKPSKQSTHVDLLCTVTKGQIYCDARRSEAPDLGISDFISQLHALFSFMFSCDNKMIVTTSANDFKQDSKGTVFFLQLRFNSETKELNDFIRPAGAMNEQFVGAVLDRAYELLHDNDFTSDFQDRGWQRIYMTARGLQRDKLFSIINTDAASESVLDAKIRHSLQQLGYTEIPISHRMTEPVDVLVSSGSESAEMYREPIKRARILNQLRGLKNTLSNWEVLHSVLSLRRAVFVENLATSNNSTVVPRLVHFMVVDPMSTADESKLGKLFAENQGVEWLCSNEADKVTFIQSTEKKEDGTLDTLPVCLERMSKFKSTWKLKRFIRPILFPLSLQDRTGGAHRGVIRTHVMVKYQRGDQSATAMFVSQNFKMVISSTPWGECETKMNSVIDVTKCYTPSVVTYAAKEGIDHVYNQDGFFEENIRPQLYEVLELITSALQSVHASSALCANSSSPHFLRCFQILTVDLELDASGGNTRFKNGKTVPNVMISRINISNRIEGSDAAEAAALIIDRAMTTSGVGKVESVHAPRVVASRDTEPPQTHLKPLEKPVERPTLAGVTLVTSSNRQVGDLAQDSEKATQDFKSVTQGPKEDSQKATQGPQGDSENATLDPLEDSQESTQDPKGVTHDPKEDFQGGTQDPDEDSQEETHDSDEDSQEETHDSDEDSQEITQDSDDDSQEATYDLDENSRVATQDTEEATLDPDEDSRQVTRDPKEVTHDAKEDPQDATQDADEDPRDATQDAEEDPQDATQGAKEHPRDATQDAEEDPQNATQDTEEDPQDSTQDPKRTQVSEKVTQDPKKSKDGTIKG